MTDAESILDKLRSVYGGKLLDPHGFGRRLYDGEMKPDEFRTLFTVYDPRKDSTLPSLGVFITVRLTYVLLMDGLASWAQKIAGNMTENLQVRDWLRTALYPVKHYTHDAAEATMLASPQVRRVLIAGTLKEFGLAASRGWVEQVQQTTLVRPGRNIVGEMILQHLIEAPVSETRAFLGANLQYDHTELVDALGDCRLACADTARVRTPQLFFYHGHKLGLEEKQLSALYQWVVAAKHNLTIKQKYELVKAEWLSEGVRKFLFDEWEKDFEKYKQEQRPST